MTRTIRVQPSAEAEIRSFASAYSARLAGLGTRFAQSVSRVIDALPALPFQYGRWKRNIRLAPVKRFPFAVMYRVSHREVEVLAVIPTRSNPTNWPAS